MKTKSKLLAVFLSALMLASAFAGCGKEIEDETATTPTTTSATTTVPEITSAPEIKTTTSGNYFSDNCYNHRNCFGNNNRHFRKLYR